MRHGFWFSRHLCRCVTLSLLLSGCAGSRIWVEPEPDRRPGRFLEYVRPTTLLQVQMRDGHVFEQKYVRHDSLAVFFAGEPDHAAFADIEAIFARRNRGQVGMVIGAIAGAVIAPLAIDTYPGVELFVAVPAGAILGSFIGGAAGMPIRRWVLVYGGSAPTE